MGYHGWRLWLCRIGWHTKKEQTLHTTICAFCYREVSDDHAN